MSVKRNRERGKRHQREIAERFDGLNLGTLGKVDILTEKFAIECKSMMRFVGKKWYEQAERYSQGKIPLVVIHLKNTRYDNDFVLLKLTDFMEVLNERSKDR